MFLAGTQALGLVISIVTKNQLLANQLARITTFVPSFLLSGLMFAIGNMPPALQVVTCFVPARYFVALMRGLYLKGVGLSVLWPQMLALAGLGTATLWLTTRRFHRPL